MVAFHLAIPWSRLETRFGLFASLEKIRPLCFPQADLSLLIFCVSGKEAQRMEMKPISKAEMTEAKIAERIAAAGIRLRFDKVALRLLDGVKAGVGQILPMGQSIAFTVTAPIKLPAKTSAALQECLRQLRAQGLSTAINGNEIRARIVKNTSRHMPRVVGFVHNPDINADLLLTIAETSLRES